MKKFTFSLETARKWRERQTELEEARLQSLFAEKQAMENLAQSLQSELESEHRRLEDTSCDAGELARLDGFCRWVMRERQRLKGSAAECEKRIQSQRAVLLEARRQFRLVDLLKEKSLLAWSQASSKEQEDLAAELYLARRGRQAG